MRQRGSPGAQPLKALQDALRDPGMFGLSKWLSWEGDEETYPKQYAYGASPVARAPEMASRSSA